MLSTRLKTYVCTHEKLLDSENPLCALNARACYVRKQIINTFRFKYVDDYANKIFSILLKCVRVNQCHEGL